MNGQSNLAKIQDFQNAERVLKGPKDAGEQSKDGLDSLHELLRNDAAEVKQGMSSGNQGGTEEPTQAQQQLMKEYPDNTTYGFNNIANPLGDYHNLVDQMKGVQGSFSDGFVMSTLDSRRTIDKITDDSADGYSMLANTFVLHEADSKKMKKVRKNPRLSSQMLVGAHQTGQFQTTYKGKVY